MVVGDLILQMAADIARFSKDMDLVRKTAGRVAGDLALVRQRAMGLFSGFVVYQAVSEIIKVSDALIGINNRLNVVTGSQKETNEAMRDVYAIAQRNYAPLRETATLYTRLLDPVRKMGGGLTETSALTSAMASALKLSGATAQESASAMLQFSQAMGSGVLRGEEFNAVNEAAPAIMRELAGQLGVNIGELREMATQGKLTADVVANALLKSFVNLKVEAESMPPTISGAFQRIKNEFMLFLAAVDDGTGIFSGLADLLDTISQILSRFTQALAAMTSGADDAATKLDIVDIIVAALGYTFETLVLFVSEAWYSFKRFGVGLGGLAAQAHALVTGDWGLIPEISRQMKEDADAARAAHDSFTTSISGMTDKVRQARDAHKGNTMSASENRAELTKLMRQATDAGGGFKQLKIEVDAAALSDTEKAKRAREAAKAEDERRKVVVSAAQEMNSYAERAIELDEIARLANEEQIKTARTVLEQIETETELLGMTNVEREVAIELRKLESRGIVAGTQAYEAYAEKIRNAILKREEVEGSIAQAKRQADEVQKISDDIGQGLTESLFRAFESGKDFFGTLWDGIKNTFKTTVLKMIIDPVQKGMSTAISGGISSLFSGSASAAGGGGGGMLSMLGSLGGSIGGLGSIFSAGMSAGLTGGLSSAGAMMSAGMTGSGLAMGLGAVAPYAMAAIAVYNALKHTPTHHTGSVVTTGANGTSTTGGLDPHRILNNYNKDIDQGLRALNQSAVGGLNVLSEAFGGRGGFSAYSRFASDNDDPSIGAFQLLQGGALARLVGPQDDYKRYDKSAQEGFKQFAQDVGQLALGAVDLIGIPEWAKAQFARLGDSAGMEEFEEVVNAVVTFQNNLRALQTEFAGMGGVFANIAGLSGDALFQLTEFAGGIENLAAQARGFVANYYSTQEQIAILSKQVFDQLSETGLNLAGLSTREEFRALLESRDVTSEEGRRQTAALLANAEAFARISDFIAQQGEGTLYALSQDAPVTAIVGSLNQQIESEASYQAATSNQLNNLIEDQRQGNEELTASIDTLAENTSLANAQLNGNLVTLNNYFGSWDDGDALSVRVAV